MGVRVEDHEADAAVFRIPARAWVLAGLAVLASYATLALTQGPVIESAGICKGCKLVLHPRFWIALGSLISGSALSIWVGALPRDRVAGWTGLITAGWCATPLLLVGISAASGSTPVDWLAVLALVLVPTLWIAQLPLGLLAASLPSPFRRKLPVVIAMHDDRPRWLQDIDATLAMLGSAHEPMDAAEIQQVAELAFALGNDPRAPTAVRHHAHRLRTLLASALGGPALRNAVELELRQAAAAHQPADPYRLG